MAPNHLPALSNAAPFHLVSQSSVDELNKRVPNLKTPITALNFRFDKLDKFSSFCNYEFRPNIVVNTESSEPYQEDRWKLIRIGDAVLEFSLPDNRCITVNYNGV